MSKRSSSVSASEALELFLDTISNAFGGIVFISLLVCILLQFSGTAATVQQVDQPAMARLEKTLRDLRDEIARLLAIAGTLDARVAAAKARGGDDAVRVKFADLKVQEEKGEKAGKGLTDQKRGLEGEIAVLEPKVPKTSSPAQPQAVTEIRIIGGRETQKKQVAVLLSGGRMVYAFKYDAQGNAVAENDDDIDIRQDDRGKSFLAKPGRGFLIADAATLERELRARLAPFAARPGAGKTDEDCYHVMIAVWPDSYRECEMLRDAVIKMNFDYGLLLMETGEPIRTGATKAIVN
jgi:hypothetical protein